LSRRRGEGIRVPVQVISNHRGQYSDIGLHEPQDIGLHGSYVYLLANGQVIFMYCRSCLFYNVASDFYIQCGRTGRSESPSSLSLLYLPPRTCSSLTLPLSCIALTGCTIPCIGHLMISTNTMKGYK